MTKNADIHAQDFQGKTPLQSIEDECIKLNVINIASGALTFTPVISAKEKKAEPQSYFSYIFKFGFLTMLINSSKTSAKSPEPEKLQGVISRI